MTGQPTPDEQAAATTQHLEAAASAKLGPIVGAMQRGGPVVVAVVLLWFMVDGIKDDVSDWSAEAAKTAAEIGLKVDGLKDQLAEIGTRVEVMSKETSEIPSLQQTVTKLEVRETVLEEKVAQLDERVQELERRLNDHADNDK